MFPYGFSTTQNYIFEVYYKEPTCEMWGLARQPTGQIAMWKLRQDFDIGLSKSFQALVLKNSSADCRELSMP